MLSEGFRLAWLETRFGMFHLEDPTSSYHPFNICQIKFHFPRLNLKEYPHNATHLGNPYKWHCGGTQVFVKYFICNSWVVPRPLNSTLILLKFLNLLFSMATLNTAPVLLEFKNLLFFMVTLNSTYPRLAQIWKSFIFYGDHTESTFNYYLTLSHAEPWVYCQYVSSSRTNWAILSWHQCLVSCSKLGKQIPLMMRALCDLWRTICQDLWLALAAQCSTRGTNLNMQTKIYDRQLVQFTPFEGS